MPFSSRTMREQDWVESPFFGRSEFREPDKMGYEFIVWLNAVRRKAGVPMRLASSYRSPERNREVGGAQDSSHTDTPCNAVDIGMSPTAADPNWNHGRFKIIEAALALGCTRIGMYPNGALHLDRTEDTRPASRIWVAVTNPAR